MSKITVETPESQSEMDILRDEANTLDTQIRERAFELFEEHGGSETQTCKNWLQAERELVQPPQGKLAHGDGSFHLHMHIGGFHEEELRVIALPDALIVSAKSKHRHSKHHLAAMGEKRIYQRFPLSAPIDTHTVHASLENGLLQVTAHQQEMLAVSTA